MIRARFKTHSEDYRPINPPGHPYKHPYWCSGSGDDNDGREYSTIVAYADDLQELKANWPEAVDIDAEERIEYTFTDRFPKPEWFNQSEGKATTPPRSGDFIALRYLARQHFGVVPTEEFNPDKAIQERVEWLKRFLRERKCGGIVLGISGGVDSTLAGLLSQKACTELKEEGLAAYFHAVRLPCGKQKDEDDAQQALHCIQPDFTHTVDISTGVKGLSTACQKAIGEEVGLTENLSDFHDGNLRARLRMTAQYYLAGVYHCAVLGTDHNSEAITGFFTKFGDGACDLTVLDGLDKRQVRLCAKTLGVPEALYAKTPTADLEVLRPGRPDEEALGFSYEDLDDFLEGKKTSPEVETQIVQRYGETMHKREGIPGFTRQGY